MGESRDVAGAPSGWSGLLMPWRGALITLAIVGSILATPALGACKATDIVVADVDDFKATAERIRDQLQPDFPAVVEIMPRGTDPLAFADRVAGHSPKIVIVHFSMFRATSGTLSPDELARLSPEQQAEWRAQEARLDKARIEEFVAFVTRLENQIGDGTRYLLYSASFRSLTKADLRHYKLPASIPNEYIDLIFSSVWNRMEPGDQDGGSVDLLAKLDAAYGEVCK